MFMAREKDLSRTGRLWLALPPLATGAALVIYILSGFSLPVLVALNFCLGGLVVYRVWHFTPTEARPLLKRRALAGTIGGVAAIFAYDGIRLGLVKFFHFTFWPFDIFAVFGRALLGADAPDAAKIIAGVLFHCVNGIGFGVAFAFLWKAPTIWKGIAWGLFLECCMITLYPGWLHVKFMEEFVSVSIVGHLAYGVVLGSVTKRYLAPSNA